MCTNNQCFRAKKNKIYFYLKINIFTAVKYCCILHGRVCVIQVDPAILSRNNLFFIYNFINTAITYLLEV